MNCIRARALSRFVIIGATSMALTLTAVNAGHAFTFEGSADGSRDYHGFTDLQLPGTSKSDAQELSPSESGHHTIDGGNTTFQFGSQQSFDQRYNPSNLLDPFAREGR